MIEELIKFAKQYHEGFSEVPDAFLRRMFETYKDTTLVNSVDGEICGFGIYQEWPDLLNFICMVGNPEGDVFKNIIALMDARCKIPDKKIVFFDETKMELKILCPH
ncbi:MAG: hypothetical protein FVQ80_15245 [Planctomycetes bacterium]|nr:hypothetical protein [Planctomycetota bacterium]